MNVDLWGGITVSNRNAPLSRFSGGEILLISQWLRFLWRVAETNTKMIRREVGERVPWRRGRRGGEAEVQESFLVPPLGQKISLKLVTATAAFRSFHPTWQGAHRGIFAESPPSPFAFPPPPPGSVHYHRRHVERRERHRINCVPSDARLAVKRPGCISTSRKAQSKHHTGTLALLQTARCLLLYLFWFPLYIQ